MYLMCAKLLSFTFITIELLTGHPSAILLTLYVVFESLIETDLQAGKRIRRLNAYIPFIG